MGKTITGMEVALRLDLKDTTTLLRWSDTELDRCVERAVADLSRFLPLEKSYEVTVDYDVASEAFTTPAAADPDYVVDNEDISDVTDGDTCTLAAVTMDVPRPVAILITDADTSITAFTIIVKGTNEHNHYIEESFYFSGGLTQIGKKYFNTVVEVELDQFTGEGADDKLDVGTSNAYDAFVQLANKPIDPKSEAITGYARDTDFVMDYANGRIKYINGGSMVAATAYTLASYRKSRIEIDLTPIKHELIRVDRLIYPASDTPQTFVSADVWGDVLTFGGGVNESQTAMSNDQHAVIRYLASHTPPSADAPGSYPDFLDNTVILAASAYALFTKATENEHTAAADLLLAVDYINEAHTQIGKVSTYLFDNDPDDASSVLEIVNDKIVELRDKIETAVNDAAAELGLVGTNSLDKATTGAEALLDTGDNFINTITIGDRVPENYREYSQTRVAIAQARIAEATGYLQEATARMTSIRTIVEESSGWVAIADRFVADTEQRLVMAQTYIAKVAGLMELADKFKAEAIERRNEAWSIWRDPKQYMGDFALSLPTQPARYNTNT